MAIPIVEIDAIFTEWDRDDSPGCALAIVQDGEIVYSRGYGMSNLEHGIPIRPSSIFHVASISKQFTATCIELLAAEGSLSLDDDIRDYVPEVPDYGDTITIRHLVHHTSGLRDMWDLLRLAGWRHDDLINEADMLWAVSRQRAPNFRPGDEYLYSNSGYALLALIIRRIGGQSLREFADERIFKPLGMTRTHVHDDHTEIVAGRTQAYEPRKGGGLRISIPVFDVAGTTSLFTTVEDMARWDANFDHHQVGGDDVIAQVLTPGELNDGGPMAYGFGLQIHNYRGLPIVEHGGADAGYRAHYLRFPDEHLTVVCLCNLSTMTPRTLVLGVADLMLADRFIEPLDDRVGQPSSGDSRLSGVYRNHQTGDLIRVASDSDGLTVGFDAGLRLDRLAEGVYRVDTQPLTRLSFEERDDVTVLVNGALYSPTPDPVFQRISESDGVVPDTFSGGEFYCEELDTTYRLEPDGTALLLKHYRVDDRALHFSSQDLFAENNLRVELERGRDGVVTGFRASTFRVRNLRFRRIATAPAMGC